MGTFDQFAIGMTALRAFRQGMNTSGYNVANASTEGFSRRRVELGSLGSVSVAGSQTGVGVEVSSLHRIRDPFLDFALRREAGRLGHDQAAEDILTSLEPGFGEVDSSRIGTTLTEFYDAFETLTTQPSNMGLREDAIGAATQLAATIRRLDQYIVEARRSADSKAGASVDRVNEILERLSHLNLDVTGLEAGGGEASDIRDERDRLIDELSTLVPVRVVENELGQTNVYIEGTGDTLLASTTIHPLELILDSEGFRHVLVSRAGEKVDLTDAIRGSQLGGYLEVRDEVLPSYRDKLDQFASALITEVNTLHTAGFDANGNAGLALFEPDPPGSNAAAAIHVNQLVESDGSLLALARVAGAPGDSGIVEDILALRTGSISSLGDLTLSGFAADLVADVGRENRDAQVALESSLIIVDSLETKRLGVSGVSLDEEAAELARWQQSFEAAAKFLQTVNRITELAINMF